MLWRKLLELKKGFYLEDMKKKHLEMILQHVPFPEKPIPELEQYCTPATIAADIIFLAYQQGDIDDKIVIDLGCGTGIFAVGAFLAGARRVFGFDVDKNLIAAAREHAVQNQYGIEFDVCDVDQVQITGDTVVMNPPFGAQKANKQADRGFLKKACDIAPVVYSLHLSKTMPFIEKMITSLQGTVTLKKKYLFPIRWTFEFHEKPSLSYEVTLVRITTQKNIKK